MFGSWTYDMGHLDLVPSVPGEFVEPLGIKEFKNTRVNSIYVTEKLDNCH